MNTLVSTMPLHARENISAETKPLATKRFSEVQLTANDLAEMEWMNASIVAIMRIVLEIAQKAAGLMRDSNMKVEALSGQIYIEQAFSALKDKLAGLEKTLDATQKVNFWKVIGGAVSVGGAGFFGVKAYTGNPVSNTVIDVFSRITTHNSLIDTIPEWSNAPGRTEGQQECEMADTKSTINNVTRETRDRLKELANQMSSLISKACTTLEEALRSLSAVYKVPFSV